MQVEAKGETEGVNGGGVEGILARHTANAVGSESCFPIYFVPMSL